MSSDSLHPTVVEDDATAYNQSNIPTVGGYVFWHTRGSDVVLIGPFATLEEADKWYDLHGQELGVHPALTHMRSPAVTYRGMWGLMPEENPEAFNR